MCLASSGKVELLDVEIEPVGTIASTVYDNKYFLSVEGKMIVIEKFVDSVCIYENTGIRAFERVFNEYCDKLAVLTDVPGYIFQVEKAAASTERIWESEDFALTYASGNQYVRQILIKTATDIDVIVTSNRAEQTIRVKGGASVQQVNLNLKGEMFSIKIVARGTGDIQISSLSVVVGF